MGEIILEVFLMLKMAQFVRTLQHFIERQYWQLSREGGLGPLSKMDPLPP